MRTEEEIRETLKNLIHINDAEDDDDILSKRDEIVAQTVRTAVITTIEWVLGAAQ